MGQEPISLFKVSHPGFKDLHILLPVNVHSHRPCPSLGVCHLPKHPSVRTGNPLNRAIRSIHIPLFVHGHIALRITVLCCHLTILKELLKPLLICHEAPFSMGGRGGLRSSRRRAGAPPARRLSRGITLGLSGGPPGPCGFATRPIPSRIWRRTSAAASSHALFPDFWPISLRFTRPRRGGCRPWAVAVYVPPGQRVDRT